MTAFGQIGTRRRPSAAGRDCKSENNYGGAVKRRNAIRKQLGALDWSTAPGFTINGLKREELIAVNSMLLAFMPRDGTLVNQWAADHTHALAGGIPALALDMYEHSYHISFGAAAAAYVDAFERNIDWAAVYERYQLAVHGASEPFGADQDQLEGAVVLDVSRAGMFEQAQTLIPGADWRDPGAVADWASGIPADREVVVYCVYGHEVGRPTTLRLRSQGVSARYLRGGTDAWQAAKRPLQAKGEAT